jgi:raffinose/stachyose/melibiose transport system substrate-binding protein
MVYNTEIFKAAGITAVATTPDEFQADLKLIHDKTQAVPLYTNYHAGWPLTSWNTGVEAFTGDADYMNLKLPHMEGPFAKDQPLYMSYKLLYDAVKAGYTEKDPTTTDWEKSKNLLATGQIGIMNLGSWAIVQMQQAATAAGKDPSVIGYMPYPVTVKGKQYAGAGPDYMMAINKNSPNQDIDKAFVDWFINQSNFAFDQGGIPTPLSGKLPPAYDSFSKAGVTLVVDTPAKSGEEGLVNKIDKEASIGWNNGSGTWQSTIVDAARGQTTQSFDDIMNAANDAWAKARKSLSVTP